MASRMLFGIPGDCRLVSVEYVATNGTLQSANISNPKSNDGLQIAMLKRGVAMSQIKRVKRVIEYASQA